MLKCLLVASSKTIAGFEYFLKAPNSGLASLASNVNRDKCDVKVLDLVALKTNPEKYFARFIKKNKFDLIGFSCMVFQYHQMLGLARIVKEFDPSIKTLLGGYYPTVNCENYTSPEEMKYFDFIIRGEGEIPFRKLTDELNSNMNFVNVPSLTYIKEGEIIHNDCSEPADLSTLKIPDRDARIFKKGFSILNIPVDICETSRGCTFTCNFCCISKMYGRNFRKYSIDRIIEDLMDMKKRGTKAVFFSDDNITLDVRHLEKLCRAIIDKGLNKMRFFTQASVKGFHDNPGLAKLMREAGFEWIFLGIESPDDESLKFFKKDNQLRSSDIEGVVKSLRKENIFVIGGIIIGNPNDSIESIYRTYEYLKKIKVDMTTVMALTPYPGTELRNELLNKNYVINRDDLSRYDNYHVNVRTDYLSSGELFKILDTITHKYFVGSGAIFRIIKRYPLFFTKSFIKFIFYHPDMVFHHLTKGRFLNKNRYMSTETGLAGNEL